MPFYPERSGVFDLTFTKAVTGNTAYTTAHVYCFHGTDAIGTIIKIMFICGYIDSGVTQDVRIYDVTNNKVIAEKLGVNVPFPTAVDLGAISNLPESGAVWEVQQRKQGAGPKEVAIASGCEYFL